MTREFSFGRDIRRVNWLRTAQLNGLRALSAGLVWSVAMLCLGTSEGAGGRALVIDAGRFLVLFPVGYLLFLMPLGLLCGVLSRIGVPFTGLVSGFFSVLIVVGDPLLMVVDRMLKGLIPTSEFGILNFRLLIFVTEEAPAELQAELT